MAVKLPRTLLYRRRRVRIYARIAGENEMYYFVREGDAMVVYSKIWYVA